MTRRVWSTISDLLHRRDPDSGWTDGGPHDPDADGARRPRPAPLDPEQEQQ